MSKGGDKKYDRNRKSSQNTTYISQKRHEKSHRRRIVRHMAHCLDNSDEMQKIAERFGVANISDRVRNITLARRDKGMTTQA
jgi:hypothetical protein